MTDVSKATRQEPATTGDGAGRDAEPAPALLMINESEAGLCAGDSCTVTIEEG
ncbi:MAG: hypothetical protein IT336_14335 [Thermomicrobiales bacterium]|nr:hypothetical protein [Thermomicrobiales bacterium]